MLSVTKETFVIAVVIFLLQQWSGQSLVGYYAPQISAEVRPVIRSCIALFNLVENVSPPGRSHVPSKLNEQLHLRKSQSSCILD